MEKYVSKSAVMDALSAIAEKERKNCREYCELNPADANNRKTDSFLVLSFITACLYAVNDLPAKTVEI